ncbi:helix-turn-helix domain-containing protein [Novosphingobium lentum]|uniref:helix-turn-helix domain-containing protein n=1 Tax=Novosphingobium lentum TaxID=145287 RepID=UPI0008359FDE|nr:helix-turn-helix domain-containing protein [Novosphingobium lentum]
MQDNLEQVVERAVRRALDNSTQSPWKDSEQAAGYLSCSAGTLKTWRSRGEGPAYHVIQEKLIRYHVSDLDAFVRGEVAR